MESLKTEMIVAQNVKKTTKMRTVVTFSNLYKLIIVTGTIPIVSETNERAFSAMRRVKYWLRSTMVLERFTNLALLCVELMQWTIIRNWKDFHLIINIEN